jgi:hypothetical protein
MTLGFFLIAAVVVLVAMTSVAVLVARQLGRRR